MTVKIKHNKAHVLYKALGYDHCVRLTKVKTFIQNYHQIRMYSSGVRTVRCGDRLQWRIQDTPNGGALFCHKWGAHILFSGKKCMKLKEIGLKWGGARLLAPCYSLFINTRPVANGE